VTGQANGALDFTNQALIHDEHLVTICLVLDHGWPAGPTFLHALNTVIETAVIHDAVYFDPLHQFRRDAPPISVPGVLQSSGFIKLLVREGAIREFPEQSVIDAHLIARGREYRYARFLADAYQSTRSFVYGGPEEEATWLRVYFDVVSKASSLLQPRRLLPAPQRGDPKPAESELVLGGQEVLPMTLGKSISLTNNDLAFIEGMNFRAKAFLDLARNTELHLHPFYLALPHQVGAIRQNNSQALELFQKVRTALNSMEGEEEAVGESAFGRRSIPALAQIVLSRCKDSPNAIVHELLALRNEHRKFREYLTNYERKWNLADSKREQWKLEKEFASALKSLLEKETPSSTRLIYTLWDVLKEPTKILQSIGDKLSKRGREEYIIGRVKGLHDFWDDLANSPPSNMMRTHFNRLFPKSSDDKTWELGQKLAETVNASLMS